MVTLTERAARKVQALMAREGKQGQALRLFVQAGGCSGFRYGMQFDAGERPGDEVGEFHGLKVLVDRRSSPYLDGTRVDYKEALMGGGFRFDNPNAESGCGCGHSFLLKRRPEAARPRKLLQL